MQEARRIRASTLCVLALIVSSLVAVDAVASPRDRIREKRTQAVAARAEVERLGMALEPAIQRLDRARARLERVELAISENRTVLGVAEGNYAKLQHDLRRQLLASWRNESAPDPISILLSGRSIGEMMETLDALARLRQGTAVMVLDVRRTRHLLRAGKARLASDEARAAGLRREAAGEIARIQTGIAQQQRLGRGLEREIAQLKQEEAARQVRLAEAARRQIAELQAIAASTRGGASDEIGGAAVAPSGLGSQAVTVLSDGSRGATAVSAAMRWLGTPYSWGGGTAGGPSEGFAQGAGIIGFDCSGLTLYAWAQAGVSLAHYTGDQWNQGVHINAISDLIAGDLVFFGSDLGHMGMYIGNGQMIHAPHTGDVVKISPISSGYYASEFRGGVRPG